MAATSKDLIKLVDENRIDEVKSLDKFKQILNQQPPAKWTVKNTRVRGTDAYYLPIDKVEYLLDTIFQDWRVEVKDIGQLAQSVYCVVRVHYKHPVTSEWGYQDGVGATPLKTDAGYNAADLTHIKSDAVATGAPAAKSYAIKDAAEHLGKLFGRDLNRKDAAQYQGIYDVDDEGLPPEVQELLELYMDLDGLNIVDAAHKARHVYKAGLITMEIRRAKEALEDKGKPLDEKLEELNVGKSFDEAYKKAQERNKGGSE